MIFKRHNIAVKLTCLAFFVFVSGSPFYAITVEETMEAALKNDFSLADARSKLKIAENTLFKSSSLYNTNLSFSGSLRGQSGETSTAGAPGNATEASVQKNVSASLSIPLAKWISIGIDGSTDTTNYSGSLSLNLTPLANADTQAELAWNKAFLDAQSAVRNTLLAVRKEYRSVLTAQAEYDWRKAAVLNAQNDLSRIQYLVELGTERKSQELTSYSNLMDAQGSLDTAENNLNVALQNLSLRTGIDKETLGVFSSLDILEQRSLVSEEEWVAHSADMINAGNSLESVKTANRQSTTLPGLSLGSTVSDTLAWSVSAKVSFSPDVIFQKNKDSSNETLVMQERSMANTEHSTRTSYRNQKNALIMAERNYENANRFLESAQVSYDETELLLEKGDSSQASLDSANEKLLSAKYQLRKAVESLENTRDMLDVNWQLAK